MFSTSSISQRVPRCSLNTAYKEERKALQVYSTEFLQCESSYFPSIPCRSYSANKYIYLEKNMIFTLTNCHQEIKLHPFLLEQRLRGVTLDESSSYTYSIQCNPSFLLNVHIKGKIISEYGNLVNITLIV